MFERVILKQLNDHIWLMDDNHEATGYIVAGSDKALVIDTMNGWEDVNAIAREVTDKPVTVVNTHGHCDHIFGNVFFSGAFINEKDLPVAERHSKMPDFVKNCGEHGLVMPPFSFVKAGDVFDLGGITVEVVELPGHTAGGICLLDKEDRILFTGDGINRHLWLQLDESLKVNELTANMENIAWVKEKADFILHGHARDFEDIGLFDELLNGLKQLAAGDCANDAEYNWFGGKALQHEFAENSVIVYIQEKLG